MKKNLFTILGIGNLNARLVADGKEAHVELYFSLPAGRLDKLKKQIAGSKIPPRPFFKGTRSTPKRKTKPKRRGK